ncbi:GNAT family N-acetyltransferase [Halalkalicoccus sp. NIPERK01]|uniref:GNAT family N-acetyltransferase n=1 Tax=Halalkalicoccus sp. NIPERK01 TaxID=3053469 RepID=UPI00256EE42E|nr:GNAT family N-acetyltransferase [Halalkalicoccus sp. NIPERK01]MDL5361494.1 GNAT family N-acetyltransferase [Halalkalicoccus sp. NIPERK01]
MELRPYEPGADEDDLWTLKRAFERGLGAGTGGEEKEALYEAKLTPAYRERYLDWVGRCVATDPRCVTVADDDAPVGYAFVLPERLAMIWDAAVLNELYVAPEHRGTGVADDLMDAACALASEQDLPLDRLVLDVDPENARARAFYDRHDFEPWGEMVARPLP